MLHCQIAELFKERQKAMEQKDCDLIKTIDVMLEDGILDTSDARLEMNRENVDVGWGWKR